MPKICAYCGEHATTKDHVVPQCLYSSSRLTSGAQLLTVPACEGCNQSFHTDEEHFRNFIVTGGGRTEVVDELFFGKVKRSLEGPKGAGKRAWLISLLKERQTVTGTESRLYPDDRVMRVVRKIIRGLAYYHFGSPVPDASV